MTKKERVLHAFHNEPVDRVPIAFWYHFSPDDDFGQETIDEHLRLYREADFDLIKVLKAIKWTSKNSNDSLRNLIILKGQYQSKQWNNIKNNH